MAVCIISIGDELLRGATVDTNTAWLASRLLSLGYECRAFTCLPDSRRVIARRLKQLANEFKLTVVTGGLGPTKDDVTRDAVSDAFHLPLEMRGDVVDAIRRFFMIRKRDMPAENRKQALVPRDARVLRNPHGTACGFAVKRGDKLSVFLPGVPREMKYMFEHEVVPLLGDLAPEGRDRDYVSTRIFSCVGLGESELDERLGRLVSPSSNPSVGLSCSPGLITIHLAAHASSEEEARDMLDELERKLREKLGDRIVGLAGETPALAVISELRRHRFSLAIQDSATGGVLVAHFTGAAENATGDSSAGAAENATGDLFAGARVDVVHSRIVSGAPDIVEQGRSILDSSGADVALVVSYRTGAGGAPLLCLAASGDRKTGGVPGLEARSNIPERITQYALSELWSFLKSLPLSGSGE